MKLITLDANETKCEIQALLLSRNDILMWTWTTKVLFVFVLTGQLSVRLLYGDLNVPIIQLSRTGAFQS